MGYLKEIFSEEKGDGVVRPIERWLLNDKMRARGGN
jgi:hypothetical protein